MKIKNTGDLRKVVAETLTKLSMGKITHEDASGIHRLARTITDSLYSETKVSALQRELGEPTHLFGKLPIYTEEK